MAATIRIIIDGKGADAVEGDLRRIGKAAEQQGGGFNAMREIATGAFRAIGGAAVELAGKGLQAVTGFLKDSISAAGDFQAGMQEFQAVAGQGVDTAGLQQFHDLFINLGKELPVSTSDVQQAAIELVKGGIDPATIAAGGLEQSIKFAAAAMGGDLAAAAETSAKVVGGWADVGATATEKADLLTHATDLLTKAANASTVDVHDLALGLYNVQGTAKTTGLSLDETTTALAELAPRFANANTAGTSFRNFLVRLQPTAKPATQAMEALGLITEDGANKFFDAQGKFVGVAKASTILQDATKGLTDAEKTLALQTIFGNDAMNAAAAFAEMGSQGYDQMAASLANANGVQDNAALKQQGLNTAMENFKGSIEALQITVGEKLLPVLTSLFNDVLAPATNTVTTLASAIFGDKDAFDQLSPTLQQVVTFIQETVTQVQDLVAWFQQGGATSGELGAAIDTLAGIWAKMREVFMAVMAAYQNIIAAVLPIVRQFIADHGAQIAAFFKATWESIVEIINLALALYKAIVPPILNAIAGFIREHGDTIRIYIDGVWKVISGIITAALTLIKGILKAALQLIQGDWQGAWETIQQMSADFVKAIAQVIEGAGQMFYAAAKSLIDMIISGWHSFVNWSGLGGSVIDGIISGIMDGIGRLVDAAAEAARRAWEAAKDAIGMGSPARLFMPVGESMTTGMAVGMLNAAPALIGAAQLTAAQAHAGATYTNSRAVTLNYTANNYGPQSPQASYAMMNALARSSL